MQAPPRQVNLLGCASAVVLVGALFAFAPHARADAPPCRYSFGMGTVYDIDTARTWQQSIDGVTHTWADASAYCAALSVDGGGWRLPTIHELHTLVDESLANPAIDTTAFPNTPDGG